ncbi:MAG: transposase family protein [Peptoniphilus sp. oral taxon 375]|nr:transposase family protein [Peptoniphilus sp. oral taxon 375]
MNLKGIVVDSVASFEEHIDIKIHSLHKEGLCLGCGHKTSRVHNYRLQRIQHTPIGLRKVFLYLRKKDLGPSSSCLTSY